MNAQTTTFVRAAADGPKSQPKDGEKFTHLYFIDSSKPQDDATRVAKFSESQLWSYGEHAGEGWKWAKKCGTKAVPRQIINNLKSAKPLFTGQEDIYKGKTDKTEVEGYKPTYVTVLSPEDFDALFTEFDAEVNESVKMADYEEDYARDGKNRKLGIQVFRKLLNSEERVYNLMKLMAGVMHGGIEKNDGLWKTYRGFFQFIISGMVEDYKSRNHASKTDSSAKLQYPHLSYPVFAQAILAAKLNLTVNNTVDRRGSVHQRAIAKKGVNKRQPGDKKHASEYATLPHMLKWLLVLAQAETSVSLDVYKKLCAQKKRTFTWSAWNLGAFGAVFGLYFGPIPAKPAPKDKKAKKGANVKKPATEKVIADKATNEEAIVDDDSDEDEDSDDEPEAPAEKKVEEAESDDDEDEDDDDEEAEESSDDEE